MKTFAKMMVACLLGFAVMCIAIASDASDRVAITVCVVTGLAVSLALGVFDLPERKGRHMSLKDGARSFEQAA